MLQRTHRPQYAPELLPPLVAEHAAHSYRDDSTLTFHLRGADDDVVSLAYATLDQVRNGTYWYTAAGPFGEGVERARELARWGDTDGAWRTLINALPLWEPLGPDHLAPLGWVADPVLGPLLTPERGRELLSTPRGGQAGEAPRPAAGLDPSDLAWLAEPDLGNNRTSYRFVLVEGVEPEELPGRLADGDGDGTMLNEPTTLWEARHRCVSAPSCHHERAAAHIHHPFMDAAAERRRDIRGDPHAPGSRAPGGRRTDGRGRAGEQVESGQAAHILNTVRVEST